ncbi:Delta-aminolevulinic acid dehydratase [Arsenophonus endosymbiont of Bemisia tabaci Q2]|nr:Delta-aminolevulinic acid dehydratase [Arsenophonus endosymbiont of Bemisia tabaci Q2]
MQYQQPIRRLRRLRQTETVRALFKETILTLNDLILPIFVEEEIKDYQPIATMPGVFVSRNTNYLMKSNGSLKPGSSQ